MGNETEHMGNKTENMGNIERNTMTSGVTVSIRCYLSILWYNPLIANELLYFKHWLNNGNVFVGDLLDNHGNIKLMENLSQSYHLTILNLRIRYHTTLFLPKLLMSWIYL